MKKKIPWLIGLAILSTSAWAREELGGPSPNQATEEIPPPVLIEKKNPDATTSSQEGLIMLCEEAPPGWYYGENGWEYGETVFLCYYRHSQGEFTLELSEESDATAEAGPMPVFHLKTGGKFPPEGRISLAELREEMEESWIPKKVFALKH